MNNSKMFLVTILSITTVLLATSAFTPLASAQYDNQGQGPQGGQGYQGQGGQGKADKVKVDKDSTVHVLQ